jgi:hypothetical protein
MVYLFILPSIEFYQISYQMFFYKLLALMLFFRFSPICLLCDRISLFCLIDMHTFFSRFSGKTWEIGLFLRPPIYPIYLAIAFLIPSPIPNSSPIYLAIAPKSFSPDPLSILFQKKLLIG